MGHYASLDGSLYVCFTVFVIEPAQELSHNCSEYITFIEGEGSLGQYCQVHWLHGGIMKLSFSQLFPTDIIEIFVPGPDNTLVGGRTAVLPLPISSSVPTPLPVVSGPTYISFDSTFYDVCWELTSHKTGGRGTTYAITTESLVLLDYLVLTNSRLCIFANDWPNLPPNDYSFEIVATSAVFRTTSLPVAFSFSLSYSGSPVVSEQDCLSLWKIETEDLYAIQTFPGGDAYLPSNMRQEGVTIQLKAMTQCQTFDMSSEVLADSSVAWRCLEHPDVSLPSSTRLFLPPSTLSDFSLFPVSSRVHFEADLTLPDGRELKTSFSIQFAPGRVLVVPSPDPGHSFVAESNLIIDLSDSETVDRVPVGTGVWEWDWRCEETLTGNPCSYADGAPIIMPTGSIFRSDETKKFREEVPITFLVKTRVTFDGEEVSYGKWIRVFNPLPKRFENFELEANVWRCLSNNKNGYTFSFAPPFSSSLPSITNTEFKSLWAPNPTDFGETTVRNIDSSSSSPALAQVRCDCDSDCNEPVFIQITISFSDSSSLSLFQLYQPPPSLPPLFGICSCEFSTFDEDEFEEGLTKRQQNDEVISLLTFVVINCESWEYVDGGVSLYGQRIYFEVENDGSGETETVIFYPSKTTLLGNQQMVIPCGSQVTIFAEVYGISEILNLTTRSEVRRISSDVWSTAQVPLVEEAKALIRSSPDGFLQQNFVFSAVKTATQECGIGAPSSPFNLVDVLNDILASPTPRTIYNVLNEAPFLTLLVSDDTIFDVLTRFDEYLDVANDQANLEQTNDLGTEIVTGMSNILTLISGFENTRDGQAILTGVFDLIEKLQSTLLCKIDCGSDPLYLTSENIEIRTQSDVISVLGQTPVVVGNSGVVIEFPDDLDELEEALGAEEGSCILSSTSAVDLGGVNPVASLSFFLVNCTTGEREEIVVQGLDDVFAITLPIYRLDEDSDDSDCPNTLLCASGTSFTNIEDPEGCELVENDGETFVCECSHTTTYSTKLFIDSDCDSDSDSDDDDDLSVGAIVGISVGAGLLCCCCCCWLILGIWRRKYKKKKKEEKVPEEELEEVVSL